MNRDFVLDKNQMFCDKHPLIKFIYWFIHWFARQRFTVENLEQMYSEMQIENEELLS